MQAGMELQTVAQSLPIIESHAVDKVHAHVSISIPKRPQSLRFGNDEEVDGQERRERFGEEVVKNL